MIFMWISTKKEKAVHPYLKIIFFIKKIFEIQNKYCILEA